MIYWTNSTVAVTCQWQTLCQCQSRISVAKTTLQVAKTTRA